MLIPTPPRNAILWYVLSVVVVGLDQASKFVALEWLGVAPTPVIPFLSLTLACNTGAAFSLLEGQSGLLAIAGILFAGFFVYAIWQLKPTQKTEGIAFMLILGGDIGNVIDRLHRGCVVDFIHVHHGSWHFPIFNLADSAISIGAALWIWTLVLEAIRQNKEST